MKKRDDMSASAGLTNDKARLAAEVCAVTRILEEMNILQYSGHVAVRVPGQDALMVQRRSDSRAELSPDRILTVDFDGKVIDGDGKPPSETSIHIEAMRARPDVNATLHSHMDLAIAFTMMEGVQMLPMRARATRPSPGPRPARARAAGRLPPRARVAARPWRSTCSPAPHAAWGQRAH
jgi:ribulose-5-phosphate 4-epimerase/fuculose-1-phosphate aldolase